MASIVSVSLSLSLLHTKTQSNLTHNTFQACGKGTGFSNRRDDLRYSAIFGRDSIF